jgi:hypothetical protein
LTSLGVQWDSFKAENLTVNKVNMVDNSLTQCAKVAVRIRPLNQEEAHVDDGNCIEVLPTQNQVEKSL